MVGGMTGHRLVAPSRRASVRPDSSAYGCPLSLSTAAQGYDVNAPSRRRFGPLSYPMVLDWAFRNAIQDADKRSLTALVDVG